MTHVKQKFLIAIIALMACLGVFNTRAEAFFQQQDTSRLKQDTVKNLPYKPSRKPTFQLRDRYGDPFSNSTTESPLFLKDPTKVNLDVELDSGLNYTIYEKKNQYIQTSIDKILTHQVRQIIMPGPITIVTII